MQRMNGFLGESQEGRYEDDCYILSCLKKLMHNKYGDVILLCSVIVAFSMLLAVSASG